MALLRFRLALLPSLLIGPAAAQTANPDRVFAIKEAKVFLGDGRVLEKGTVVLRRGRIEAVGESVEIPFDAETIDGTGLTVHPGFIDAFSSLGVKAPEGASPNEAPGVDTSVTIAAAMPEALRRGLRPEFSAADSFALDEAGGKAAREAGFCAALVGPAGGILAGQSALVLLSGSPRRSAILKGGVAVHGAFQSGGGGGGYPSTKMGILAVLRQAFLDARHWAQAKAYYERKGGEAERPPEDGTLATIAEALEGRIPVAIEADDADDIRRAVALSKEFGFRLWIVGGREAWKVADLLKAEDVPVILGLDFGREPRRPGERRGAESKPAEGAKPTEDSGLESGMQQPAAEKPADESKPAEEEGEEDDPKRVLEDRRAKWEERVACAAKLHEAGLRVALTTSGTRNPKEFLENLEKAIGKGLPREAAIAALTVVPARLCGLEGRLGTIAPGRIANLVATKGEPGAKDAKVRWVFVDGRKFEIEEGGKAASSSEKKEPPAPGINLSGTWEVTMEGRRAGGGPTTVRIQQDAGNLSGTWSGQAGSSDFTGTLSGKNVELSVEISFGERSFTMRLEGTVESKDRMSGDVRGGGRGGRGGGGKWTAVRKPGSDAKEAR